MSEFRQDLVSRHWVLFAPNRGGRPEDLARLSSSPDPKTLPSVDKKCVFCPGNEEYNQELASYPKGKYWRVRVIPNKYEALGHMGGRQQSDFYIVREGIGDHEVIITRPHDLITAFLPEDILNLNLWVYQERMRALSEHPEVQYVHVIQNHGREGGASLMHPHSQIFATPFVPEHLYSEVNSCHSYYMQNGACVYCEMIMRELQDQVRIILDDEDFLVFAPFASRVPYAMRIIPKVHQPSFMDVTDKQRASLARVLKQVLGKLFFKLNNPSYNYYIHTLPASHTAVTKYDVRSYHWHLEILPRVTFWGGFELGSDVYVNIVMPEAAADVLRQPI
jgi:UDPglucose--hexose-1-phosphate uridylyltransferase